MVSLWRGSGWWASAGPPDLRRAVLWDIVVAGDLQGHGLDRRCRRTAAHPAGGGRGRVYLMTTKSAEFYRQLGFQDATPSS